MNFKEINYPAIVEFELADEPKVWVWNPTYREWNKASEYSGDDYLYITGDKPLWKGSLLTLEQSLAVLKVVPELRLWRLYTNTWSLHKPEVVPVGFCVFLILPVGEEPVYDSCQWKIRNLMLAEYHERGKKLNMKKTNTTTKPKPHKHSESIIAWAKDTSQPVWVWNNTRGSWLRDGVMAWLEYRYYAVGEKTLNKPTKTVIFDFVRDYVVLFDVPYDATEESIMAEGYRLAPKGAKVSYSILKDNT